MTGTADTGVTYAELQCMTNFSLLEGASHGEELAQRAKELGLAAFAVTDRNSLAGVVRAHIAAKDAGIRFIVGARLDFADGPSALCYPTDRAAYGRLSSLITIGRRRAPKGECLLYWSDFLNQIEGQLVLLLPPDHPDDAFAARTKQVQALIGDALSIEVHVRFDGSDGDRLERLIGFANEHHVAAVATNAVLYHSRKRKPLQDVLTCVRHGCTIEDAGYRLVPHAEYHLKSPRQMAMLFQRYPEAIARSGEIADRCTFSLDELRYEYPEETRGSSATPQDELVRLTWLGADERYPEGIPDKVRSLLDHELRLIEQLQYAAYFLTVYDIVRFARSRSILCQGRGSAANSAVCFCLGVTSVNPAEQDVLFERFISAERREPPDIDIDFEHERREEVIQHIYKTYTRERAGIAATVISYRPKSALRDVGKALGLSPDTVDRLAKTVFGWGRDAIEVDRIKEAGVDPGSRPVHLTLQLASELIGFPRHLSQHVGGFVISRGPLAELVPIENASMEDRTVIQWDKDDIDALGILKIDVLALGMLTCIRKAFDLVEHHHGKRFDLATIPQNDIPTYDMLCKADSVGVFQVESRAQMTMLPRLRPRNFYDLVVEVAIVRPGPIQGDMVHPYLLRRSGKQPVSFPSKELEDVLGKTLGVPLFQEQAMRIAIVCAGFSPGEADQLRRAMATFKKVGTISTFQNKLIDGMTARGYKREFAEAIFKQLEGFGEYGFPESHAASFALLVYASAWLKCHYPAAFGAAILNSQPMGFYAPAQLVRDARDHGVEIRPIDVNHSHWDCTLEATPRGPSLRLGFRQIKGCRQVDMERLIAVRGDGYFTLRDVWRRAGLGIPALELLARADAFGSIGVNRRDALWAIRGLAETPLPLFDFAEAVTPSASNRNVAEIMPEPEIELPRLTTGENVAHDYRSFHMTLRQHPMALLRPMLKPMGTVQSKDLAELPVHKRVKATGLVLVRQRPGTASGVIFATLEDECGVINVIIWPRVFERFRKAVLGARLMCVEGKLQREDGVIHVVAETITDYTGMLGSLGDIDVDGAFDGVMSRADEFKKPTRDVPAIREVRVAFPDGRNFK